MDGKQLRRIRQRLKHTQASFAALIGTTANTVARWERGERTITEPTARLITLLAQPTFRPDAKIANADWPKRTRDVDASGKPARRASKSRKGGR